MSISEIVKGGEKEEAGRKEEQQGRGGRASPSVQGRKKRE